MKIAHFGTFDVPNFGDLLFPLIARRRLSALEDSTLIFVSPVGGPPVLPDAVPSISFEEFAEQKHGIDCALIGGGNIIRVTPTVLDEYQRGFTPVTAYPDLWLGATALSVAEGASICWNAPGVPEEFAELLWPQIATCLKGSAYISVRDESSKARLLASGAEVGIQVVPDTAWEVDALWSADDLRSAFAHAYISRGVEPSRRSIAFHINDRYLFGLSIEDLAGLLDETCESLQATAILLAMGRCHGDHDLAIQVGQKMRNAPLIVDQPASLCEITACIAHSVAYVGSSMHGFITASAFGVPAIAVARKSVPKFEGMMNGAQLQNSIFDSWSLARDQLLSMDVNAHRIHLGQVRSAVQEKLDEHWRSILTHFRARQNPSTLRAPSARQTTPREGLLAYRANVLAPVALEQMHAARRQRAKFLELSLAVRRRKVARGKERK